MITEELSSANISFHDEAVVRFLEIREFSINSFRTVIKVWNNQAGNSRGNLPGKHTHTHTCPEALRVQLNQGPQSYNFLQESIMAQKIPALKARCFLMIFVDTSDLVLGRQGKGQLVTQEEATPPWLRRMKVVFSCDPLTH